MQQLAVLVVGDARVEAFDDERHDVDADDVVQPEGRGARPAQQRPGQRVDFLYAVAVADGVVQQVALDEGKHAVGDEVGRVLAAHHALAEHVLQEGGHALMTAASVCSVGINSNRCR